MEISQLSSAMSMAELQGDIGYLVMAKALDQFQESGAGMQKILESSVTPNLGQNIDYQI